ncbi:MAG TPA: acetyltransferase [Actinomycetes bacterium]|jgi:hypothetical protein|nr:acetyltransferase [Actinomycetes bacterium]
MPEAENPFASWAIVDLMGKIRLGGYATEETHFGQSMLRLDVPDGTGELRTRYFGGGAIYSVSPCSEELARWVAKGADPAPVKRWELPAPDHDDPDDDDDQQALLVGPEFD